MHGAERQVAWYAIRTRSRREKLVHDQIAGRGLEAFLPVVERRRRWADRWKQVAFPLFPGYCFARVSAADRLAVLKAKGVVEILGMNGEAVAVPDAEIEAVRTLVTTTLPFDPHPYLTVGMEVEVVRGPLDGVRGLLIRKDRKARLVLAIHLIRQAVAVEMDADDVRPLATRPPAAHADPTRS